MIVQQGRFIRDNRITDAQKQAGQSYEQKQFEVFHSSLAVPIPSRKL